MNFTWKEIEDATCGKWLLKPVDCIVTGIQDDSRKAGPGDLFVAVVGELADGHDYVLKAAKAGVPAVCVQRVPSDETMEALRQCNCGCLLVEDGLKAFQSIARYHRLRFKDLPVLAVTGSCGKTSTKEMCAAVLERKWPGAVIKTIGNTNNHFGVPRNLLRINEATGAAVIEEGSNHPGEIAGLSRLVNPLVAVITCIGAAHLEFFHDLYGVAEEKGDIFLNLPYNGTAIIPYGCTGMDILKKHAGNRRVISFGLDSHADVYAIYNGIVENGYAVTLVRNDTGEKIDFTWSIGGECQAGNAAAAAAVGIAFGMDLSEIARGLQNCELPGSRMSQSDAEGVHWVNDAYNANPSSMIASLKWFKEISAAVKQRVIIIGDMRELGENSASSHEDVLGQARAMFPNDTIITVGTETGRFAAKFGMENFGESSELIGRKYPEGSWIFLKASFGIGLFKLVPGNDGH